MQRIVQAELLDSLPPQAPAAVRSRRDLRLINGAMGNGAWFRRELPGLVRPGERVLEVGAGDGWLAHRLGARLPRCDGLDRCPRPRDWPAADEWHQVDVLKFGEWARYPVVFGNLVFHHFADPELAQLGAAIREHARVVVASEPARAARAYALFALFSGLIRADPVTRHDGRTSIAAGFAGDELPRSMGFQSPAWRWSVRTTALGAYRFIAVRT